MGNSGFDFMAFAPLVLIFVVFYFLLLRPQQKKMKVHQAMLAALRRGDRIVTNGGLIGVVVKILSDQEVQVEIAENVRVKVARAMISEVLAKTEPATQGSTVDRDAEDDSSKKEKPKKVKKAPRTLTKAGTPAKARTSKKA